MRSVAVAVSVALCGWIVLAHSDYDIVIYGSSPAAVSAAVQAKRMGKTAVVVSPETRIGGLTMGGLGQTDIGNKAAFGGIALEFYRDVARYYRDEANWKWQPRKEYLPDGQCAGTKGEDSMWTFEPSAALKILEGWEKRDGLMIHRGKRLDRTKGQVKVEGLGLQRKIRSFKTEDGTEYRGKMFVDATYEGDLMAAAGVSYVVGREANSVYGETINGIVTDAEGVWNHNMNDGVSAFVKPGDRSSGLLPGIEPYDPSEKPGDGDKRVQAYCFRMCLTDVPENRIPFVRPANYDEKNYELLFRDYEAAWSRPDVKPIGARVWTGRPIPSIMSRMPNRKTDSNNRCGFSTDFIGRNWRWPEASYEEREQILKAHLDYQMGLMWTLANHPRIPEAVRAYFSKFGTCKDEFADGLGNGWQRQLYVREARRMVGDYVMTEHNCRGKSVASRPVAMGAYTMDSHHVRRVETKDGFVRNEGNVEADCGIKTYGIDYGAIIPKRGECANLFVPVCLSASHIAFGSIRMEPVFFALGQVAGTAAALAIDRDVVVQDLEYGPLRERLLADGQVLAFRVERTFVASCDGSVERYIEIKLADFRPEAGALIALHGHGSDRHQFAEDPRGECKASREAAASRGMLYVTPDYRAKTSWMGPKAESDILDLLKKLRADYGVTKFFFCGGSMGGTSALTFAARHLGVRDAVTERIERQLGHYAPVLATAGVAEMLLQSHAGCIDLLPALPKEWTKGGSFRDCVPAALSWLIANGRTGVRFPCAYARRRAVCPMFALQARPCRLKKRREVENETLRIADCSLARDGIPWGWTS